MVCKFCGHEEDSFKVCPNCGKNAEEEGVVANPQVEEEIEETEQEKVPFGLKLVSFLIPLVGIILYFVNRKDNEKQAKACIKAAVISIVISIVFSILMTIATIGLGIMAAKDSALAGASIDSQYEDVVDIEDGSIDVEDGSVDFDVEAEDETFVVPPIE